MNHTLNHRLIVAAMFALAATIFASNSFAALNAYLTLKGANGKTYQSTVDPNGKFSFTNVEPGTYSLIWVCDDGSNPPSSIEISSFSWGATNSGSVSSGSMSSGRASGTVQTKTSQVTRSNISNNRVSCPSGVTVATGDVDGDGTADMITSPVTITSPSLTKVGMTYQKIVFENVMVSSVCSPGGACKASWNLKKNVK
jgi:hypothetical protein